MSSVLSSRYSLDGVRRATTAPQEELVLRTVGAFEHDHRILAGYLVGGFAVGTGDAFSDVDLQFLVDDSAVADLAESWAGLFDDIAAPTHVQPFPGAIGGSIITADW